MNLTAEERLTKARIHLNKRSPFFSYLAMHLKFIENNNMPTMGVDSAGNVYYNNNFVDKLANEHLIAVLCHEVSHVVFQHLDRKRSRDSDIHNIACDIIANNIISKNGFILPSGAYLPHDNEITIFAGALTIEHLDKKTSEEVYDEIAKSPQAKQKAQRESGKSFDEHIQGGQKHQGEGQNEKNEQQISKNDNSGKGNPEQNSQESGESPHEADKKNKQKWKRVLAEASEFCFDDKTEILTESGWKLFKDVIIGERVATMHTATKKMEFQPIKNKIVAKHNGHMIKGKNKNMDFLVTPNHRFFVFKGDYETFVRADQLGEDQLIPRSAKWCEGIRQKFSIIPEYKNEWDTRFGKRLILRPEIKLPIELFLKLLGWFLSEGSCTVKKKNGIKKGGIIHIGQSEKHENNIIILRKIAQELNMCGIRAKFKKRKTGMHELNIANIQLANYFKQFGKSHEKFIPTEIKNLDVKQLKILQDNMVLGDGHKLKLRNGDLSGTIYYYTTSKQLADDFQEISLKMGEYSQIFTRKKIKKEFGRTMYRIACYNDKKVSCVRKKEIHTENYNGKVYCVTVPNEVILVRRNGIPIFTGNSKSRGNHPEGVDRYIDKILNPTQNWKQLLYRSIVQEIPSDYTYQKMSKRSQAVGVYLPSIKKENANISIVIDTSGSIENQTLRDFISEIVGIQKSFDNMKMTLVTCDCKVHDVFEINGKSEEEIMKLNFKGGGGTDMENALRWLEDNKPETRLAVVLSDGYTDKIKIMPRFKVLWVLSKNGTDANVKESGDVIKIEE